MKLVDIKIVLISILAAVLSHGVAWSMTIQLGSEGIELINPGDEWQFFRGTEPPSDPADAWQAIYFNDSGWETGQSGFGYGDDDDETELDDMQNNYLAVYIRKEFTLDTIPASGQVVLEIDFDDGFIAYLNDGRAEERDHMPAGVATFETQASSHEAGTPERYSLGLASDVLVEGKNVLAIEGHNTSKGSTDFSLIPALRTSPDTVRNDETWIVDTQTIMLNGSTDAPAAVSVTIDGANADFNSVDGTWTGEVSLVTGLNTITVEALDAGANVVDSGSAEIIYVPAANRFSGELTGDTTWSGACILDATVVVPDGNILTIEPGTVVLIAEDAAITVNGQLLANGTESEPIRFTHYGDGTTWERIMFIEAEDSRLAHCIIEYAHCEGDHKDYYDNDCDDGTPPLPRTYHEAVVSLASHVDIEACVFQNLPDSVGSMEGDAIAIVSDDPQYPGEASANISSCQFLSIGAGVHTRYAYVLVENCFFTDHHGDNDDVDLYGESTPVPMIRNNLFLDSYDDYINPTRCSAVMIGNVVIGGNRTDNGVVLRDLCSPVMINNLIYNCGGGIAVQNQCNALLINNTIVDCDVGIKFWDHTGRRGPPYCLYPGSGSATVVNCIIWDCPTSFDLDDSPYPEDRGSHATVLYSNVQGGEGSASVSTNSTLTWVEGNIDSNPQFADPGNLDYHLKSAAGRWDPTAQLWVHDEANSPCIDAGTSYLVDDPNYGWSGPIDWRGELWPHGKLINMGAYGGTGQASMSTLLAGNAADANNDGAVNGGDLLLLAQMWLRDEVLLHEDINRDHFVDFLDFAGLGEEWQWHE